MPYHRPIPDSNSRSKSSSGFGALVEAEKLMQIAFVLPSALVICWVLGWWLAHVTHQKWIEIAGIVFGCITGLVYVIQMAISVEKKTSSGDGAQQDNGKGTNDSE
jgi:ATP synthase protein I